MTNTEVLRFIISGLENSPDIIWKGDKELFELIFDPIPYGNDIENRQKEAKQFIFDIFQNVGKFDKAKFNKLVKNIISGGSEESCRKKIVAFLQEEITRLEIITDVDIEKLVEALPCKGDLDKGQKEYIYDIFQYVEKFNKTKFDQLSKSITCGKDEKIDKEVVITFLREEVTRLKIITDVDIEKLVEFIPCKDSKEKNYKTSFSGWKKEGTISSIGCKRIKKALQKNFYFESDLWSKGDTFIKQRLQEGINKFIIGPLPLDPITPSFTQEELDDLLNIRGMKLQEIKQYLEEHPILSQNFVEKLIYILYDKEYYDLLVDEVFNKFYKDDIGIKKIKAHVWGSDKIGKYLEAYYLLSTIPSDDDDEIVNMKTAATSNMRRHQLNDAKTDNNQKKEIIETLISDYKETFESKDTYNYYPGINLAYMSVISIALFGNEIKLDDSISTIYNKSKKSIDIDKKNLDTSKQYYANITTIEFMLLNNIESFTVELEQFLDSKEQTIIIKGLLQTRRQMQFFIDTLASSGISKNPIILNMQKSIKIIDDFIDGLKEFEM